MDCKSRVHDSDGICFRENVCYTFRTHGLHLSKACYSSDILVVSVDQSTTSGCGVHILHNHMPVQQQNLVFRV